MSDAYSIQAKLQLDTSKFTAEINKITKNINTLSKTLSSMLGGEFEKTSKNVVDCSKKLNAAVGKDFKNMANVAKEQSKVINEAFGGGFSKTIKNINNSTKSISKVMGSDFKKVEQTATNSFKNVANTVGSSSKSLSSVMTSNMKNSTTSASSQASKLADAFKNAFGIVEKDSKKASGSIKSNFTSLTGALGKVAAIGGVTAGVFSIMHKGLERFSILQDFPKQMQAFGVKTEDANNGIKKLKESIMGLPVSLSDAAVQTQQLYATTRNFDKSTKLVIALNGAFAAARADVLACDTAFRHFNKALSEGNIDMRSMHEIAFAMGPALDKVALAFGYAEGQTEEFKKDLVSGKITVEEFSDKLADMEAELSNLGKEAGGGVSTSLANLNNSFASLGESAWEAINEISIALTGANLQENIEKLSGAVKMFTSLLKEMFPKAELKEGSDSLKEALPKNDFLIIIGHVIKFVAVLGALALGFVIIAKIVGFVMAVFSILGTVLGVITAIATSAAAPFIALGVVIAAVVALIIYHWDEVKTFFINLWNGICQLFTDVINDICKKFNDMGAGLSAICSTIGEFLSGVWNSICGTARWLWDTIVNTVVGIWNSLISKASEIFGNIKKTITDIWNGISSKASEIFGNIKKTITDIWDGISSKASEIWEGIKKTIKDVWDSIAGIFNKVTRFFGGGGAEAASVSLTEESISTEKLTRDYNLNHNFNLFKNFIPEELNANVSLSTPTPIVYVLLDGNDIATKSFSAIDDLINAKTIINKSRISGAM